MRHRPFLLPLWLAVACGSVDAPAGSDAAASVDSAPAADAGPDATPAPGEVTLRVLGTDHMPRPAAMAVFVHPDGSFAATATADATGTIKHVVEYGETVHIGWSEGAAGTSTSLVTIARLEPGEEIVVNPMTSVPDFNSAGKLTVTQPTGVPPATAVSFLAHTGCRTLSMTPGQSVTEDISKSCVNAQGQITVVVGAYNATGDLVAFSVQKDVAFSDGTTATMPDWQSPAQHHEIRLLPPIGSTGVSADLTLMNQKRFFEQFFSKIMPGNVPGTYFLPFDHAPNYADDYELSSTANFDPLPGSGRSEVVLYQRGPVGDLLSSLTVDNSEQLPRVSEFSYSLGAFRWKLTGSPTQLASYDHADCVGFHISWSSPTGDFHTWEVIGPPGAQSPLTFTLYDLSPLAPPADVTPNGYIDVYETGLEGGYFAFKREVGATPFVWTMDQVRRFPKLRFQRSSSYFP